ncbi:energy-coupling factor transporter transmembrane component T [Evansella sp. AB-P1]|uniref:energy-coupling factor transporter transmembrane component T n=1 Tax=Evansella sp. AB-P1 TaxID=3037653 RepID=UPI00241FA895|nr:energy-coupling factor transporter transmembrane component T [Evansella sp. AB-P1]MDG5789829.1 energy-coupling factor transporter transmembrane component T [Evansella sp. AB-P1]
MIQRFDQLHPFVSFFYYFGAIVLLMLLQHPISLSFAFLIIVSIHIAYDKCKSLRQWVPFIFITGLFILLLNPIFNERGRHVVVEILGHRVTLEALVYGGMTGLTIMGIIALFVSYNEVMTPNKLLFLFSKIMPQFAVLLMLTLRFIPLMKRRLDDISTIQQSKGITVVEGPWKNKVKNGLMYVQVLLTYSLEEAIQTADSMKSREYGKHKRSSYEYFRFRSMDVFAIILLCSFLVISIVGRMNGHVYLNVYPVMDSMYMTSLDMTFLLLFCLYLAFPILVQVGGYIRWHLLN